MEVKINAQYSLISDTFGFNLVEKVVTQSGKKIGTPSDKIIGYSMSIEMAINKVIHLQNHSKDSVLTLNDFLKEWRDENNALLNYLQLGK